MRNHPSPDSLEQQREQQAAVTPAPAFAFGTNGAVRQDPKETAGRLPGPAAGFASNQPSTIASAEAKSEMTSPETRGTSVDSTPQPERTIDIPDFSQLAASFKNTPLALPERPNPTSSQVPPAQAEMATHSGSFYVRPRTAIDVDSPQQENNVSFENERRLGRPAFVGSRPEPVVPPQPVEAYQLNDRPTSFQKEDFQPRLISKRSRFREVTSRTNTSPSATEMSSRDVAGSASLESSRPKRISLAPPEPDNGFVAPAIPDLKIEMPKADRQVRSLQNINVNVAAGPTYAKNQVHSYYDVGSADASDSVLDREDFQPAPVPVAQTTNRRIPFGLNPQGQQELTRIRSRQQTNIDLQTDRFSQHTTRAGDTLQSLSSEYYGKPDFYLDIYLANQQLLRNPAVIPAGIQLRIPKYGQ